MSETNEKWDDVECKTCGANEWERKQTKIDGRIVNKLVCYHCLGEVILG